MANDLPEVEKMASRESRVERVVAAMDEWIVQGKVESGDRLPPEGQLAEHFNVSRTVIREAVRLLTERGLIEVAHGKRHRVRPPSPEIAASHLRRMIDRGGISYMQLMELRWPLETAVALVAARRRTEEQLDALRQCLASPAEELDAQVEQDARFHKLLARATQNIMFEITLEVFAEPLTESRRRTISRVGYSQLHQQHVQILDAVASQQDVLAEALMKTHLEVAIQDLKSDESVNFGNASAAGNDAKEKDAHKDAHENAHKAAHKAADKGADEAAEKHAQKHASH